MLQSCRKTIPPHPRGGRLAHTHGVHREDAGRRGRLHPLFGQRLCKGRRLHLLTRRDPAGRHRDTPCTAGHRRHKTAPSRGIAPEPGQFQPQRSSGSDTRASWAPHHQHRHRPRARRPGEPTVRRHPFGNRRTKRHDHSGIDACRSRQRQRHPAGRCGRRDSLRGDNHRLMPCRRCSGTLGYGSGRCGEALRR